MGMLRQYLLAVESPLTEAQNYISMFNDFIGTDESSKATIQKYIDWARSNLRKNDRIVWFLRWVRVELAGRIKHLDSDAELDKLNRRMKAGYSRHDMVPINNLMTNLQHYLSMPIDQIQNVIWGKQSPQQLLSEFKKYEDDWKETSDQRNLLSYNEGEEPTKIIQFPDGYAWFDLETHACREEGKAMGHCGNTAAGQRGDTIFSLRRPAHTVDGRSFWYPMLTFIRDDDGYLGEMKGRANDKPARKYHPYIVELLKSKYITGIKGGGYLPSHNFKMSDLDPDTQAELVELKPDLGELDDMYSREGMTSRVLARLESALSENGLSSGTYQPDEKRFVLENWRDYDQFLGAVYADHVEKILEIAMGEADFQHSDPEEAFIQTLLDLPDPWRAKLAHHAGVRRDDDHSMVETAHRLISQDDDYYRLFYDLANGTDSIQAQAWERLYEYQNAGWTFAAGHVYTDVPSETLEQFRQFVESKQSVHLYVNEDDMVGYGSADPNGDNGDYDYDIQRMRGDYGRADWDAIDSEYQTERWREDGLTDRSGDDEWLKEIKEGEGSPLTQEYLKVLQGERTTGQISDPRQQELSFESLMRRHMNVVSNLQMV